MRFQYVNIGVFESVMEKKNLTDNSTKITIPLIIIIAITISVYLASNVMAVKVINVFGVSIFDAGTILFPIAYMLGDVLTEVWGFKTAKKVIFLTFFCNTIFVAFTWIAAYLPSPLENGRVADAYNTVFAYVPRIVIASLIAYLAGELVNAWCFVEIKKHTGSEHLWMRTIGSSVVGYIFDTVLFVVIAYAGTYSFKDIFSMTVIQYFVKLLVEAIAGTPLAYASVGLIKRYLKDKQDCDKI